MQTQVVEFVREKETKATWRFVEVPDNGGPVVGYLYVKKAVLGASVPARIRATLEVVEDH